MSDLEPVPQRPTCPICATEGDVQREGGRWVCFHCWTVFTGEQGEWERSREQRKAYRYLDQWRQTVAAAKEEVA